MQSQWGTLKRLMNFIQAIWLTNILWYFPMEKMVIDRMSFTEILIYSTRIQETDLLFESGWLFEFKQEAKKVKIFCRLGDCLIVFQFTVILDEQHTFLRRSCLQLLNKNEVCVFIRLWWNWEDFHAEHTTDSFTFKPRHYFECRFKWNCKSIITRRTDCTS